MELLNRDKDDSKPRPITLTLKDAGGKLSREYSAVELRAMELDAIGAGRKGRFSCGEITDPTFDDWQGRFYFHWEIGVSGSEPVVLTLFFISEATALQAMEERIRSYQKHQGK